MDKDYHQECMICGEEDIGSNKVYVPRHSNKSRENTSHGGPFKNFNTENQCKDWESNTEPKYSSERSSLVLKEAICMSNDLSNKSMESTSTGTESRETDPEKFVTNLEENCDDTKHRQVWTQQILLMKPRTVFEFCWLTHLNFAKCFYQLLLQIIIIKNNFEMLNMLFSHRT